MFVIGNRHNIKQAKVISIRARTNVEFYKIVVNIAVNRFLINIPKISETLFFDSELDLPSSKSIANRWLMIRALSEKDFIINRLSESNDTKVLNQAILNPNKINLEDAGTPYRFFTAYAALKGISTPLLCSSGLKKRPIHPLVEALTHLGAEIKYLEQVNYPPIQIIKSVNLDIQEVDIDGSMSSQFISALLLIAPFFKNGLNLHLKGKPSSLPYIRLTLDIMQKAGIAYSESDRNIHIPFAKYNVNEAVTIESDWSAASFIYGMMAVHQKGSIKLKNISKNSLQGDVATVQFFEKLGVQSHTSGDDIILSFMPDFQQEALQFNLIDYPDMFPVLAAVCIANGTDVHFSGIENLAIKESNRIAAMKQNTQSMGAVFKQTSADTLHIDCSNIFFPEHCFFKAFDDHRIAMACSLFAFKTSISIDDETVVKKSFPDYWEVFIGIRD
jgi:3-phosphoshikimate 1-carboxyvinyltransferase